MALISVTNSAGFLSILGTIIGVAHKFHLASNNYVECLNTGFHYQVECYNTGTSKYIAHVLVRKTQQLHLTRSYCGSILGANIDKRSQFKDVRPIKA